MNKILLFLSFIVFFSSVNVYPQDSGSFTTISKDRKVIRAYKIFNAGEYFNALEPLKEAYDRVKSREEKAEIVFMIGECYRKTSQYKKAALWYNKSIGRGYDNPIAIYYYAQALKQDKKYEDAIEQFEKYLKLVPDDERASAGIKSCELSKEWVDNPNGYIVEQATFFNSKVNDYCPVYARDDYNVVYFTSTREEALGDKINGVTGEKFPDIFSSTKDKQGNWSVPQPLNLEINTENSEGTPSLDNSFNTLVFTRCEYSKNKKEGCQVYFSKLDMDEWGKADVLQVGKDSLVVTHPALSYEGDVLYFVSNMEGGYGGYDIWYVKNVDGKWEDPVNVGGEINTRGNELFPYSHPDGTLYFSSDAHLGMGGLDIFKAERMPDGHYKVVNLGYPLNSTSDDFGITFEATEERGFLTSNRGIGTDDDIYAFVLPPLRFNVIGEIISEEGDPINEAYVKLISSDGTVMDSETDSTGKYKFMLKPETDYIILASAKGYLKGKEKVSTKGLNEGQEFEKIVSLASTSKVIELPNIYYDLGKATLRPESKVSLDKLVEILNDNPNVVIELMAHTDSRGSENDNLDLSQRRAQSVIDYLIDKGINELRLEAVGYGESVPKVIDEKIHENVPFFPVGTKLDEEFINQLTNDDYKEIAYQINRRTEFRVISENFRE